MLVPLRGHANTVVEVMSQQIALWSSEVHSSVFALLTLPSISKEYEAFTDSISGCEIGISNRKLQKVVNIIWEFQLAPRNFVNESCWEVNLVLELRHRYVLYRERDGESLS